MREVYDVAVIGSGFGGSVVACRLAQAGRSVAVLERGRRWAGHEFPRAIGHVSDAFWSPGRSHGFLEYLAFRKVDVIQGAGVGGGSLHYFNVNVRAPAEVFDQVAWPPEVTAGVLAPFYEAAADMLQSAPLRPPAGRVALPRRSDAFVEAAARAGLAAEALPIAVFTGADRPHPVDGAPQSACTYCGNCLFGCDVGAKNTLDRNYLALAETHGAEIHPLHAVTSIAEAGDGSYVVAYQRSSDGTPTTPPEPGTVRARSVVVAGGALGSTELLLRSRDEHQTLPRLGPALGTRVSLNGEFLLAAARDTTTRVDPGIGPPITAMVQRRTDDGHILTVEDLGLPDPLLWYLEGALPPPGGRIRKVAALAAAYAKRTVGLGDRRSRVQLELDALIHGGRTPHALPFLGMGTDSGDGTIRLRDGSVELQWQPRRNRRLYREMEQLLGELSQGAGGRFSTSVLWRWPVRKVLTAHLLGGCPMGTDPRTSVVDHRGQVWGHPGLYVVDGAAIPSALAVNPSLTIAAVAERAAFWMTNHREPAPADAHLLVNR